MATRYARLLTARAKHSARTNGGDGGSSPPQLRRLQQQQQQQQQQRPYSEDELNRMMARALKARLKGDTDTADRLEETVRLLALIGNAILT